MAPSITSKLHSARSLDSETPSQKTTEAAPQGLLFSYCREICSFRRSQLTIKMCCEPGASSASSISVWSYVLVGETTRTASKCLPESSWKLRSEERRVG